MGHTYQARCKKCGHEFEVSEGGGFAFHLLRCDECGKTKSISFDEIGEPHLRYIKGLKIPYSIATQEKDRQIQENYPGEPISEEKYHSEVEKVVGKCGCGGQFRFEAPPRCPKCKALDIEDTGKGGILYD
jgi:predicted Zn-ribbon and HTH transcriptional regulator